MPNIEASKILYALEIVKFWLLNFRVGFWEESED